MIMMSNSGDASSMDMNEMVAATTQLGGGGAHEHHQQQTPPRGLKKGPWTAAEDSILMEYVKKHGEGNWNAVQKNSGLARCGKSCRLRWANHLRPNLKKGSLTAEEERIIIELHAKYGNKWARMASQLPGRTDNEIKNYWNTRMKRRLRAGLPIYPHELQLEAAAASFHHHHHQQQQRHNSNSSSSSFSSLLSSSHPRKASYSSLSLYDHINFDGAPLQNNNHCSNSLSLNNYSNPAMMSAAPPQFNANNGGFAIPLSPVSPFGSSASALFNQTANATHTLLSTPSQFFNSSGHGGFGNYSTVSLNSSTIMGTPPAYEPMRSELPLNQTPPYSPYTPTKPASSLNGGEGLMEASGNTTSDGYEINIEAVTSQGKRSGSGLLDDVLVQADNMSRNKRSRSGDSSSGQESGKADKHTAEEKFGSAAQEEEEEDNNAQEESTWKSSGEISADENLRDGSSSPSVGMKQQGEDPLEDMDDDLLSLLNFQSTAPVSNSWYGGSINSDQESSGLNGASVSRLDIQQNTSSTYASPVNTNAVVAEPDVDELKRSLPPCFWNNMPGFC